MPAISFLQFLGYLGLLPFILLTILTFFPVWPQLDALTMFQRYSAIILAFMAGVLWPVWSQQAPFKPLAIFAVALPVLSFSAGVLFQLRHHSSVKAVRSLIGWRWLTTWW